MQHSVIAQPAHRRPKGLHSQLADLLGAPGARVALLPGTATAAWEVALSNTLSPGDRVLVLRNGPFSDKLAALARLLGLEVSTVAVPWGQAVPAATVARHLARDTGGAIRAVLLAHVETGTGVSNDVAAIRAALDEAGHKALLGVDVVGSAGAMAVALDAWRADLAVATSRLGLTQAPGVGIVVMGPRAESALAGAAGPRSFFDLRDPLAGDGTALAPRVLRRLAGAVADLDAQGRQAVVGGVRRLAEAVRAAVAAWGLETVAEGDARPADTVTAVALPRHVDGRAVARLARERHGCTLGAGLGALEGRALRLFHPVPGAEADVLRDLAVTELALVACGMRLALGAGVAAAQTVLSDGVPKTPHLRLVDERGVRSSGRAKTVGSGPVTKE